MRQKTDTEYFSAAEELRTQMLKGSFPEQIRVGFRHLLEYYGQYPIIVRSSSLLEDGFGNAFAGKYDSFSVLIRVDRMSGSNSWKMLSARSLPVP